MRIWSLHPKYLDTKGFVTLWRETLLAKNVLEGNTIGYRNHPQLIRFKQTDNPLNFINKYLEFLFDESIIRNYHFDKSKFTSVPLSGLIPVTNNQINFEFSHLLKKLEKRDPNLFEKLKSTSEIEVVPIFRIVQGEIESWERI